MALKIVWSEEAEKQLDDIIDYLSQHWSSKEISVFFNRLEEALEKIQESPQRFKNSLRKVNTKEFQLSKHTSLFYSYNKTTINILLLWVNRKDPKEMEK